MPDFTPAETAGMVIVPLVVLAILVFAVILGVRRCRAKRVQAIKAAAALKIPSA